MTGAVEGAQGWMINGFTSTVVLVMWGASALAYALWRSLYRPDPDPIRLSGPID